MQHPSLHFLLKRCTLRALCRTLLPLLVAAGCLSAFVRTQHRRHRAKGMPADLAFEPTVDHRFVRRGETLWSITAAVTGKPHVWPQVWALNPQLTNPHWVQPGNVIHFRPTQAAQARQLLSNMDPATPAEQMPAEQSTNGPRIEVIRTAVHTRQQASQRVFAGTFVTATELKNSGTVVHAQPDRLLLRPRDTLYVSFTVPPAVGDALLIYRAQRKVLHPRTGHLAGYMAEATGTAVVTEVTDKVARVLLRTAVREVERGQKVMPLQHELQLNVKPLPPKVAVQATVLDIEGDMVTAGEQKLVFIDKGADDGLERGTTLMVRSSKDTVVAADRALPAVDVASLLVVEARRTLSTCLVLDAFQEIWPGDVAAGAAPTSVPLPPAVPAASAVRVPSAASAQNPVPLPSVAPIPGKTTVPTAAPMPGTAPAPPAVHAQ
jgi:hypothetical protein